MCIKKLWQHHMITVTLQGRCWSRMNQQNDRQYYSSVLQTVSKWHVVHKRLSKIGIMQTFRVGSVNEDAEIPLYTTDHKIPLRFTTRVLLWQCSVFHSFNTSHKRGCGVGGEEGGYGAWKQKYTYLCISTYPEWLTNCWSSLWLFLIALNNLCHVLSTYYWNNFYFFLYLKKQMIFTIVSEFQTLLQTTSEIRGSKQMSGHKLFEKISNQQLTRNKR